MPYAAVQEEGRTISAKVGGWLLFRGGPGGRGGWVRAKTVVIPARPFLGPATEDAAREFPTTLQEEFETEAGGPGVDFS
jgi:phage gpG-like protein